MLGRLHPIAGIAGFLTILLFWTATVASELFGTVEAVVAVKRAIPWGFTLLIPSLALAGASGFRMAGGASAPLIVRKKRRMPIIAGNGILVLVPAALYLSALASRGDFGTAFYAVQAVELMAGALNITLMGLNVRDGLRLTGRLA
jgi:hypothetical protein